jgi:hypothetical protein
MDYAMQLRHLAQAERHVVIGEKHIADQAERIVSLDAAGHDSTLARSLLVSFRLSQDQHLAHMDHILRVLGQ